VTLVLAALAIVAVTLAVGLGLRRWTAAFPTLRRQLLVITTTGVVVAALAAWLLARLMILDEDQLGPVLAVLALAAVIAGVLVAVATSALGRTARELARTVGRIEAGDRQLGPVPPRSDELGRVAAALDRLSRRLAELEAEHALLDRERTQMLSSISHDLRSPLSALRAALDALVDGVAPDPPRYLRSMQADVAALTALVDDFFLLARIEGGHLDLDLGRVDLSECCDEAVEALTPTAAARGVTVKLEAVDHVRVRGNTNALGRWCGWCGTCWTTPSAMRRRDRWSRSPSATTACPRWRWPTPAPGSRPSSRSTRSTVGAAPTRAAAGRRAAVGSGSP
jgi:signal transduction histidine kinase